MNPFQSNQVTKMTDEATGENLELDMEILKEEDMTTPRPTAGHPRDKVGKFPGHDKARCKMVPIGREQTKNVCKELNKITEKFSNEEFKCNICSTGFSERDELEEHNKTNHVCFSTCVACKKQFPDGNGLNEHLRQHHQDQDPLVFFTSDAWKKQFPDGNGLNQHLRQHHQDPNVIGNTTNFNDNVPFDMNLWLRQQEQEREERERVRREEREEAERIRREEREQRIRREEIEERDRREEREKEQEREAKKEQKRIEEKEKAERIRREEREDRKRREEREERRTLKFPKFLKEEDLDTFSQKVKLWNLYSKSLPGEKMLDFLAAMEGRPKEEREIIETKCLKNEAFDKTDENILEKCIKVLDNHFGQTDLEKTVDAWREFLNVKKTQNEPVSHFVQRFEHITSKFKNLDITIPDRI